MIKLSFTKTGLRLLKGLRLFIFEKVYKAMFIQGATFIREVRVRGGRGLCRKLM